MNNFNHLNIGSVLCQAPSSQSEGTDWLNFPLQDGDHSANGPHYVFGSLSEFRNPISYRSGTGVHLFWALRKKSASFDSWALDFLFCSISRTFLSYTSADFLRHRRNIVCNNSENNCVLWLFAPRVLFVAVSIDSRWFLFFSMSLLKPKLIEQHSRLNWQKLTAFQW